MCRSNICLKPRRWRQSVSANRRVRVRSQELCDFRKDHMPGRSQGKAKDYMDTQMPQHGQNFKNTQYQGLPKESSWQYMKTKSQSGKLRGKSKVSRWTKTSFCLFCCCTLVFGSILCATVPTKYKQKIQTPTWLCLGSRHRRWAMHQDVPSTCDGPAATKLPVGSGKSNCLKHLKTCQNMFHTKADFWPCETFLECPIRTELMLAAPWKSYDSRHR